MLGLLVTGNYIRILDSVVGGVGCFKVLTSFFGVAAGNLDGHAMTEDVERLGNPALTGSGDKRLLRAARS
jgi:hypothetical protein